MIHWREYLMEAAELGVLMFCICLFGTLLYSSALPLTPLGLSCIGRALMYWQGFPYGYCGSHDYIPDHSFSVRPTHRGALIFICYLCDLCVDLAGHLGLLCCTVPRNGGSRSFIHP
jgi:hypothetical protein